MDAAAGIALTTFAEALFGKAIDVIAVRASNTKPGEAVALALHLDTERAQFKLAVLEAYQDVDDEYGPLSGRYNPLDRIWLNDPAVQDELSHIFDYDRPLNVERLALAHEARRGRRNPQQLRKTIDFFIARLRIHLRAKEPFQGKVTIETLRELVEAAEQNREVLEKLQEEVNRLASVIELSLELRGEDLGPGRSTDDLLNAYRDEITRQYYNLEWIGIIGAPSLSIPLESIFIPPMLVSEQSISKLTRLNLASKMAMTDQEQSRLISPPTVFSFRQTMFAQRALLFIGDAGIGKSTSLRYLSWLYGAETTDKLLIGKETLLPVHVRLSEFAPRQPGQALLDFALESASCQLPTEDQRAALLGNLQEEWRRGRIILLLDAFDEFAGDSGLLASSISRLAERAPDGNRIIVTSRPYALMTRQMPALKPFVMQELALDDLGAHIERMFVAIAAAAGGSEEEARIRAHQLSIGIDRYPLVKEIATRPLLLTFLVILGQQPEHLNLAQVRTRAQLVGAYLDQLVEWDRNKPVPFPTKLGRMSLLHGLAYLALQLQIVQTSGELGGDERDAVVSALVDRAPFRTQGYAADAVMDCIEYWKRLGILDEYGPGSRLEFRHLGFQSYGAARAMTLEPPTVASDIWTYSRDFPQWEDARAMWIEMRTAPGRGLT